MSFFENTRDPKGFGGRLMVTMMNLAHTPVALWGLHFLHLAPDAKVLDCGCGGGANIKRLLKRCPRGIVKGVDYSAVSVEKSRRLQCRGDSKGSLCHLAGQRAAYHFCQRLVRCSHSV